MLHSCRWSNCSPALTSRSDAEVKRHSQIDVWINSRNNKSRVNRTSDGSGDWGKALINIHYTMLNNIRCSIENTYYGDVSRQLFLSVSIYQHSVQFSEFSPYSESEEHTFHSVRLYKKCGTCTSVVSCTWSCKQQHKKNEQKWVKMEINE